MPLPQDLSEELAALTASLCAHLEAEAELGGLGLAVSPPAVARPGPAGRSAAPGAAAAPSRSPPGDRGASTPVPTAAEAGHSPNRVGSPSGIAASATAHDPPAPSSQLPPQAAARVQLPLAERVARLQRLADEAAACTACVLHEKRNKSVFARGSAEAELVFVGEGPGRDEDAQGFPFVGAAGQLLDRMIAAMGYGREEVYICNVVKCRPPDNRTPRPEEAIACARFLVPQIELIAPKVIVALGRCAAQALGVAEATGRWRGRWGSWHGIPTLPTYHPAFLLRSPEFKRTVWEDLQLAMARLGRKPPARG